MTSRDRETEASVARGSSGPRVALGSAGSSILPFFIRAHARAVGITFLAVLLVSLTVGLIVPRPFVASSDLWLDHDRGRPANARPGETPAELVRNTEVKLLTSRELAARTVGALGLERVRGLGQPRDGSRLELTEARRRAIRAVQEGLAVELVDEAFAVRIRFKADTPELAASVVNRLADLYVDDRNGTSAKARGSQRLAAQVAGARDAIVQSETALATYRSISTPPGGDEDASLPEDASLLDGELADARADATAARARQARAGVTIGSVLRDLESRRAQRLAEGSPESDALERQYADQKRRLDRYGQETRLADARVRLVSRMRERSGTEAATAQRRRAELARLTQAVDAARTRYAEANAALARDAAASAGRESTAYVISRSSAESATREPATSVVILGSIMVAALAATLAALALEGRLKGFRTARALENALGIRVLAAVPALFGRRQAGSGEDRLFVPDYVMTAPGSDFAEVFRSLLRALQENRSAAPLVVAVSSALPDEGKTTVALCLSRIGAASGARTVLVDCDLRRPAASRTLFPTLPVGLVEVIEAGTPLSEVLQRDPGSEAMVLGLGSKPAARMTALEPKSVGAVIERLKQDYDLIVCDTPPALALAEARDIAALADAVLLVVRQRQTPKGAVTIAQDLLKRAGARIGGAVLTMVRA